MKDTVLVQFTKNVANKWSKQRANKQKTHRSEIPNNVAVLDFQITVGDTVYKKERFSHIPSGSVFAQSLWVSVGPVASPLTSG